MLAVKKIIKKKLFIFSHIPSSEDKIGGPLKWAKSNGQSKREREERAKVSVNNGQENRLDQFKYKLPSPSPNVSNT